MLNNINIYSEDDYKIFDKLAMNYSGNGLIGWVRIFLQTKNGLIYDEGSNLVCAQGREFVAQKIFNIYNYSGGTRPDFRSRVITHFAIGGGGSTISGGGTVTLNGPYICDTQLLQAISLGSTSYLTEPGGVIKSVKKITDDSGSSVLEVQNYNNSSGGGTGSCNYYTKIKNTCIIPAGEPDYLSAGESVKVDEAGLYFTLSLADPLLFSHICFAPKWKEKESTLTIVWYILC